MLKPSALMNTNDELAKNVNKPAYEALSSSAQAQKVGWRKITPQVRSSTAGRSACGLGWRRLSSKRHSTSAIVAAPNRASTPKAARQPIQSDNKPPSGALMQASTPKPVRPLDIMRAPSTGA